MTENKTDIIHANPKDVIGSSKLPLHLVPASTMSYIALGHLEGDLKYGKVNWREAGIRATIYIDACLRHIMKFKEGEWADSETRVPHLASALCCLSILVDAYHADKLIDDRPKSIDAAKLITELEEIVRHLKGLHGDKKPVDYFIDGPKQRD